MADLAAADDDDDDFDNDGGVDNAIDNATGSNLVFSLHAGSDGGQ